MIKDLLRKIGIGKTVATRQYNAGKVNRLTADWVTSPMSADATVRYSLQTMRSRSRQLAENNDYMKKFLRMVETNVVGTGVKFQSKVREGEKLDMSANKQIEVGWEIWGQRKNCTVSGQLSWDQLSRQVIRTVAMDGEIFIRKVTGYDNKFRFALQVIEADLVDETMNEDNIYNSNNIIRMGIELNEWRKPVAYWVFEKNPYDYPYGVSGANRIRIPAEEICHVYIQERPSQTRGVPWAVTAMTRLNNLGGYEEAEIISARLAACKMGFFKSAPNAEYAGDGKDASGNTITEAEPGAFEQLPPGTEFETFDPQHPTTAYGEFVKSTLRGIASGLGVSYTALANDLESTSYSSSRVGLLEERDTWRIVQSWFVENFAEDIFPAWLQMALLTSQVNLPVAKFDKFNAPKFVTRGWDWTDPETEVNANLTAIQSGFKTRTQVAGERGEDLEEIFVELQQEKDLAEQYGITFTSIPTGIPKFTISQK